MQFLKSRESNLTVFSKFFFYFPIRIDGSLHWKEHMRIIVTPSIKSRNWCLSQGDRVLKAVRWSFGRLGPVKDPVPALISSMFIAEIAHPSLCPRLPWSCSQLVSVWFLGCLYLPRPLASDNDYCLKFSVHCFRFQLSYPGFSWGWVFRLHRGIMSMIWFVLYCITEESNPLICTKQLFIDTLETAQPLPQPCHSKSSSEQKQTAVPGSILGA